MHVRLHRVPDWLLKMVSITPPVADMVKADGVEPNADGTDLTVLPADYDFPKADAAFASHAGMRASLPASSGPRA